MCETSYAKNRIELTGRVVRDIELRKSANGESYCFFTIAVDGAKSTDFIEVKAFGDLAVGCVEHAKKGVKISCLGSIHSSKYEKDGVTQYRQNIILSDLAILKSEPVSRGVRFVNDAVEDNN